MKNTFDLPKTPEDLLSVYNYSLLDPRSIPVAQGANDKVFSQGDIYGIEVTNPVLAQRCKNNLDPQHGESGDVNLSAIKVALNWDLPPKGSTLVTIKPDIDSIGAMAVLVMRQNNLDITPEIEERINFIDNADRASNQDWSGPHNLPSSENPWPPTLFSDPRTVAILGAAVSDFRAPVKNRIEMIENYLSTGELPLQYEKQVEDARRQLISALENGGLTVELDSSGRIATVIGKHRDAMTVGYSLAPVVVAFNPTFSPNPSIPPHAKYTVAQYKVGYANLKEALNELNEADSAVTETSEWGGNPGILGSTQGISSQLSPDQVTEIVRKHLSDK